MSSAAPTTAGPAISLRASRKTFASSDAVALGALAVLFLVACVTFYNQYAFDDSYVGYTIARSLLRGEGFTFNAHGRMLSTSAPLAVPLYAALAAVFHASIVQVAQWASALAFGTITFGVYGLARRVFTPLGAFVGTASLICSPFIVLLWSHETLLYLATAVSGAYLYVRERRPIAALVLGFASLFRGEALLLLPIFWIAEYRRCGRRAAFAFAGTSLAPYLLWALWATAHFGTFFSATIASKHAQGLYAGIPSYVAGLAWFVGVLYAVTPSFGWGLLLALATCGCFAVALAYRRIPLAGWALIAWAAVTTALYLVLRLPFYFWFASQIGCIMALGAASMWPQGTTAKGLLVPIGRACAFVVLALNLAFLGTSAVTRSFPAHGAVAGVESNLHENAYKSLGLYLRAHARKGETISFVEFGQLRYYSERDVVDYLGLATPGAAEQLASGNAIWTFKTLHPSWVIDSPPWQLFVSPTEYDWFRAAYHRTETLVFPGDPIRRQFTLYHVQSPRFIPPGDVPDPSAAIGEASTSSGALEIPFTTTRPGASEVEARIAAPSGCKRVTISVRDAQRTIATADRTLDRTRNPSRITLAFAPLSSGGYWTRINGCDVHLAHAQFPARSVTVYRNR